MIPTKQKVQHCGDGLTCYQHDSKVSVLKDIETIFSPKGEQYGAMKVVVVL